MSKHTPGHALTLIRAYFRDSAQQEEADERRAGRPPLSKSFAGYLKLCDEAKPLADAAPELLDLVKDYQRLYETYAMQDMEPNQLQGELQPDVFKQVIKQRNRIAEILDRAEGRKV